MKLVGPQSLNIKTQSGSCREIYKYNDICLSNVSSSVMSVAFRPCKVSLLKSTLFKNMAFLSSNPISVLYLPRGMSSNIALIIEKLATPLTRLSARFSVNFPLFLMMLPKYFALST